MNTATDFEPLFARVEEMIKTHGKFAVAPGHTLRFTVNRYGWSVDILVKLVGSRKRATEICGRGDTAEEAVEKLGQSLDHWATVCR
jgi:hypothetical protein